MTNEPADRVPRRRAVVVAVGVGLLAIVVALVSLTFVRRQGPQPAKFVAVDPVSGDQIWAATVETYWAPATAGERVVLIADNQVWAVNKSGGVDWETAFERASSVHAAGPSVYVITHNAEGVTEVAAMDPASGTERWRADGFLSRAGGDFAVLRRDGKYVVLEGSSGSQLGEFSLNGGNYAVGPGGVSYAKKSGKVWHIDIDGERSLIARGLHERTKVAIVTADTVIVHFPRSAGTRVMSGYDIATGDELWSKTVEGFGGAEMRGGTIMARVNAVEVDLDPRTGGLTPNGGWTTIRDEVGNAIASVAEVREAPDSDDAIRYLSLAGNVIAVDRQSNEVMWSRPTNAHFTAADGVALFRDGGRHSVVDARTGATVAQVERKPNTSGVVGGGRALVARGGDVLVFDSSGSSTQLAKLQPRVRAEAVNADYAVVLDRGRFGRSTRVYVFGVADQATVLDRTFDGPRRVALNGATLIVGNSGEEIAIDLRTGAEDRNFELRPFEDIPSSTHQLAAMDADRTRLLWTRQIDSSTTFHQVGGTILVSSIPPLSD